MPHPRAAVVIALCLLVLPGVRTARAQEGPLKGLDDYITKALKEWEIPGLAVAVVKDDAVVLAKGYGVRKLGESAPVTERTLFAIGSASKAFTAASLAMLVDEGKVKWDDPVSKHLPRLQFHDPYVTREITVRDLLSHRSGLARHELVWYASPLGRDEILGRMRHAKPSWSFRSKFGYQNVMFLAAGQVVPAVTGKSWDDFVGQRIFKPLGMTASNTSVTAFKDGADVATPHEKVEDKVQAVPWRNIDNVGPAGSINSNVVDMAQWIRLQLGQGVYNKERLLSSGAVREMHTPQAVVRLEGVTAKLNPETHFRNYGLGWFLSDYRGRKVIDHGGAIDGMIAQVALVPEEKLGLVVLTNESPNLLATALKYRIIDAYLGGPQRDWSADFRKTAKGLEDLDKEAEKKQEKERVKDTRPSLALERYAGTYKDDLYGEIKVVKEKDKLVLHYGPAFIGDLEHWHYDTFRATWKDRQIPKALVTFRLDGHAKVEDVKITMREYGDVTAKRSADAAGATPAVVLGKDELRKFLGKYETQKPPLEASVELVGDRLKLVASGFPEVTLVPVGPTRFKAEGAPAGTFVQFEMADGKVKGVTVDIKDGPSVKLLPKK